ncbi:hypothetical protein F5972_01785 [Microbispora cellulosiformans]|uniref:Uncharacterized protein n=1 Tax=Microbispora cellulosiformans TaxID=2614688 RepID=A0A5J5KC80_9ACTN|nr:Mut7-C RNAse domain-containing protein [Microbispora cellulosiformans]KAA9381589.1 hypothetical protein F5972_01785 [Microbispora cellulosiformans]
MATTVRFDPELWLFLAPPRHRRRELGLPYDGTSSLGRVVESAGVPLTEIGGLTAGRRPVPATYRPLTGEVVEVHGVDRPQPIARARFVLDGHLVALSRRLRLVGVDVAYRNDVDDDTLVAQANAEERVLLIRDRGILRRRGSAARSTRS